MYIWAASSLYHSTILAYDVHGKCYVRYPYSQDQTSTHLQGVWINLVNCGMSYELITWMVKPLWAKICLTYNTMKWMTAHEPDQSKVPRLLSDISLILFQSKLHDYFTDGLYHYKWKHTTPYGVKFMPTGTSVSNKNSPVPCIPHQQQALQPLAEIGAALNQFQKHRVNLIDATVNTILSTKATADNERLLAQKL